MQKGHRRRFGERPIGEFICWKSFAGYIAGVFEVSRVHAQARNEPLEAGKRRLTAKTAGAVSTDDMNGLHRYRARRHQGPTTDTTLGRTHC